MRSSGALLAACAWFAAGACIAGENAQTALASGEGMELVQANCGACHSLALVTQNRMSRERWISTIRWMQDKQGLWDLGESEARIVDYLQQYYGVTEPRWRRKPLNLPDLEELESN
jgi:CxxC motif-containing protein (DUF1111 family)